MHNRNLDANYGMLILSGFSYFAATCSPQNATDKAHNSLRDAAFKVWP
jgi:hypothetical protein